MSLASSRLSLTHRCVIERAANAASLDEWGTPDPADWQPHLSDQPCRAWASAGREAVTDTTTIVVVEDLRLIVPLGTDVTEQDRIASVTSRGDTIQAGPLSIRGLLEHKDHIELVLVKVA
jgi:hypothetical protein